MSRGWIFTPEDELCEAMAKAVPLYASWRHRHHSDRRCARRARISRDGRTVCWQHNLLPEVRWYDAKPAAV